MTWQPTQSGYQITWTGNTITYQYDAVGRLTRKNLPNGRYISYTYDSAGRRTQMTDFFGGQTAYSYDGLGSTKALTDANRNIQASYVYDAWGNVLQTSGTITNPYLYVGELSYYVDGDSGMYLLTQRWYNPVIGRFGTSEPLWAEKDFLYVFNNPTYFVDPWGMQGLLPQPPPVCPTSPRGAHEWKGTGTFQTCIYCGATRFNPMPSYGCEVQMPIGNPGEGGFLVSIIVKCGDLVSAVTDFIKCLGGKGSWDPGPVNKKPAKPKKPAQPSKPKPKKPKPVKPKPLIPPRMPPRWTPFPIYL